MILFVALVEVIAIYGLIIAFQLIGTATKAAEVAEAVM
jgi:F0F1-type ATP synthase membrane subunit c/vacuolar-type H+-ATPase subunit K